MPEIKERETSLGKLAKAWEEHRGNLPARVYRKGQKQLAENRLAECQDLGTWREVIERMARSRRCNGENPNGWKATFDLLLLEETRAAVLNGRFDDPPAKSDKQVRISLRRPGPVSEGIVQATAQRESEAAPSDDREAGRSPASPETVGLPGGAEEVEELAESQEPEPSGVAEVNSAIFSPPTGENSPPSHPPIRSFEDPDAPPWILELVDRLAAGFPGPQDEEAYRRWCAGEDVEAPEVDTESA